MRLSGATQLTYCTNVHPGEHWPDVRRNLETHVAAVKALVSPTRPFGVGLWLSADACRSLRDEGALRELQDVLAAHDLYVFTLNGFPYGAFHQGPIKQHVYEPDWRDERRRAYSDALADVLAALLPPGVNGSVSSLPGGFRPAIKTREDEHAVADQLLRHVAHLHAVYERTGKQVTLALEPEPCCFLETIDEALAFFARHVQTTHAVRRVRELTGVNAAKAADLLERHLGLCLDACHAAVEFEQPREIVDKLRAAAIRVSKVQLSSGLRIAKVDATTPDVLAPYLDPVYLHQVVESRGGELVRYLDLPEALAALHSDPGGTAREWRIHFHVPIFIQRLQHMDSTQSFLRELLALQREQPISEHLEVETYTWDVLPEEARPSGLSQAVARELRFCMAELGVTV